MIKLNLQILCGIRKPILLKGKIPTQAEKFYDLRKKMPNFELFLTQIQKLVVLFGLFNHENNLIS